MILDEHGQNMSENPGSGGPMIKDTSTREFMKDVIEGSKEVPVLVDFWAQWCGPCKALGPVLEKQVTAMGGKVRLVKMDIDQHPEIPQQLGVRSIPAVFGFVDGKPVDAFQGAVPESQIKAFIAKLLKAKAPEERGKALEQILKSADDARIAGDFQNAVRLYTQVLQQDPANMGATAGYLLSMVETGSFDDVDRVLEQLDQETLDSPEIKQVMTALHLKRNLKPGTSPDELLKKLESDPSNYALRYELADSLLAAGKKHEAVEALLHIVAKDRTWEEDKARQRLLELFDSWGAKDPNTTEGRKRLSRLLFN